MMTIEESKNLEEGNVIGIYGGYDQILKKISDGYLVLYYSDSHKVYNVEYRTFDFYAEYSYELCHSDYEVGLFECDSIQHRDDFGACEPIEND